MLLRRSEQQQRPKGRRDAKRENKIEAATGQSRPIGGQRQEQGNRRLLLHVRRSAAIPFQVTAAGRRVRGFLLLSIRYSCPPAEAATHQIGLSGCILCWRTIGRESNPARVCRKGAAFLPYAKLALAGCH